MIGRFEAGLFRRQLPCRPTPCSACWPNADLATGLHPERTRLVFGFLTATVIAVAIKIVGW